MPLVILELFQRLVVSQRASPKDVRNLKDDLISGFRSPRRRLTRREMPGPLPDRAELDPVGRRPASDDYDARRRVARPKPDLRRQFMHEIVTWDAAERCLLRARSTARKAEQVARRAESEGQPYGSWPVTSCPDCKVAVEPSDVGR